MKYREFFETFGASYRMKHTQFLRTARNSGRLHRLFLAIKHLRYFLLAPPLGNRLFTVYSDSPLPDNFIHLHPWEGEYLFQVASQARLGIVEVGRLHGGSTFLLACANSVCPIYSIDNDPVDDTYLKNAVIKHCDRELSGIDLIVGDSQSTQYPHIAGADVIFIDGDHSYEGCKRDLYNWWPILSPGGHMLFHDCYQESVLRCLHEFISTEECGVVLSPYKSDYYSFSPYGSIAHIQKHPKSS